MERGWRGRDPTRPDLHGLDDLRERLRRQPRGAPGALPAGRRARRRQAGARRDRGRRAGRHRAPSRRRGHAAGRAPRWTRHSARCCVTPPPAGSTSSRRCPRTSAAGSARWRNTTSWSRRRAIGSTALTDRLRSQTLDRFVEGLSEAIQGTTPEDLQANREMVRDLNSLLEDRLEGREPSQDEVDDFLAQHGQFFPGARTLDDIVEQLTQRMAAMQSLLRSMTPQQRAELQSMMDALLRDDRLRWDLARLAANMDQLMPDGLGEGYDFSGDERLGLEPRARADRAAPGARRAGGLARRRRGTGRSRGPRPRARSASCSATSPPATSTRSTSSPASSNGPATSAGGAIGSSSRRAAAGGSARRSSTTCSRGCRATRSAAIGSTGPAGEGSARRRRSRTSSATRSISTSAARSRTRFARPANAPGARGRRAGVDLEADRLRGLPDRAAHPDVDRPPRRHEPLDAPARLLPRGEEGRGRARHADPDPVPARRPRRSSGSPTTPASSDPRPSPS